MELSIIFKKMNININEVLEAAETKWTSSLILNQAWLAVIV